MEGKEGGGNGWSEGDLRRIWVKEEMEWVSKKQDKGRGGMIDGQSERLDKQGETTEARLKERR